jgi:pimeloyl-ACP methyl ester carboxylesterase
VLTPCDAYENFPPAMIRPMVNAARIPGFIRAAGSLMRFPALQRSPIGFGLLTKRPLDEQFAAAVLRPIQTDARIRAQVAAILRGMNRRHTLEAATKFAGFQKPVLVAWAAEDKVFSFRYAKRLADGFPDARLERIEDSYTFVSLDQPARLAELIAEFASEQRPERPEQPEQPARPEPPEQREQASLSA